MSFLSIQDLYHGYGDKMVLEGLSLDVNEGEFVSLLGPSGCGKTTVLKLIAGFERPARGVIAINGEVLNELPAHKRNMGMVFQNYAIFPHMSVFNNVAYGLRQRKMDKSEIGRLATEALDLVQLRGMEHRTPDQLSGGQQQRVALARAIVIKPRLLLLDESLSALDRKLRIEMQVELRKIQQEIGITTLFVTHDQEEALSLSDRVALLQDGVVVQYDAPSIIYEQPKNSFVASFLGQANFIKGPVSALPNRRYEIKMENGHRVEFGCHCPLSNNTDCAIAVRPEKISLKPNPTETASIKGTVTLVTYAGGITQYVVRALGMDWSIQMQNVSARGGLFQVGDEVWFGWEAANSLVL